MVLEIAMKDDLNPIQLRFYNERFKKEKKYFRLHEKFVAIARTKPLTGKFYAKHDVIPECEIRQEYIDLISKRLLLTPKDIYTFRPPTVNMEYAIYNYIENKYTYISYEIIFSFVIRIL